MIKFKEMDGKRIVYDGIIREYFEPQTYAKFVRAEKYPDGSGKIGSCYDSIEGSMRSAIIIPTLEDFDVFIDAFNFPIHTTFLGNVFNDLEIHFLFFENFRE